MNLFATLAAWFAPDPPPDEAVQAGLRRISEVLGPVLAAERDFERRLSGPLRHALAYCAALEEALPASVDIDRAAFADNPLVHALFASADDIGAVLGRSPALRDYLSEAQAWTHDHCHALMAARRHEKRVLGVARHGNMLSADMPQSLLYFSDHMLVLPAADQATARLRLRAAAFDSLLTSFAEHLERVRKTREATQVERELEKVRLQSLRGRHADPGEVARHCRLLADLDARLRESADALLPTPLLGALADFLQAPEQVLSLSPVTLQVDRSGVLGDDPLSSNGASAQVSFMELTSRDRRRHVVVPVRLRCDEARLAVALAQEERERMFLI
jgi:hypothetical protein